MPSAATSPAAAIAELHSLLREKRLDSSVPAFEPGRPEPASTGFADLDAHLGGGLARGEISECFGPSSVGCMTIALAAMARATRRGELTAYVDAAGGFDPRSAERAGVCLDRLLWVRCGEDRRGPLRRRSRGSSPGARAWKAAHLIVSAGGFGLIVLDLIGLPHEQLRELQSSTWFGLRKSVAHSSTVLLTLSSSHVTGSVAAQTFALERERSHWRGSSGAALHLAGISIRAARIHQRRGLRGRTAECRLEARR